MGLFGREKEKNFSNQVVHVASKYNSRKGRSKVFAETKGHRKFELEKVA
jgi:hypothetical protein